MEQKTIGKFITALRRANGLTQKELAEKLNVSDKTVSRWERDEGAPDLSLIPVIAEIFGVTCDELLRGERCRSVRSDQEEREPADPKSEKQRRRLLRLTLSRFRSQTVIAVGISVLGLIAALVCNLAFLRAVIGFLLGAAFFVAALVCQFVFLNRAFLGVEDAGLEERELSGFKREVIRLSQISAGVTAALTGFTFPLVLVDAYVGLSAGNMLLFGLAGAAAALLLYAVILYFVNGSLLKKGIYTLEEKEARIRSHNCRLKKRCAGALAVLLLVTLAVHYSMTVVWGPGSIMQGTVFTDYDSFIAFMEQDIPMQHGAIYGEGAPVPDTAVEELEEGTWYDENGNEVSRDEALRRTLTDADGNVVCEYIARNETVCSIRYSAGGDTLLPITVSTYAQLQQARQLAAERHVIFAAVYAAECAAAVLVYFLKRAK
ncbi:MAG: helix-turn-helix transcriptional regulator [Oscillospiraceae bacterium]|nr:helix-turn-helix transcriptional regulator [Oscillospiraceae bacterium]